MGYLMSPDDLRLIEGADADFDRVTETWVTDPLNTRTATGALGIDWSMIDLTTDGTSRWIREAPDVPDARLRRLTIASTALGEPIGVTVYVPPGFDVGTDDYPLLLFFDGYGFFEIDQAHRLVEQFIARGEIEPAVVTFIYNPDATRNRDMSCYPPMHQFLRGELLPALRERFRAGRQASRTVVAGRSRSGLGAACAAWKMPGQIGGVISQSGAFWWAPDGAEYEWLAREKT
jgi:enterochelin esterase family protein